MKVAFLEAGPLVQSSLTIASVLDEPEAVTLNEPASKEIDDTDIEVPPGNSWTPI